MGRAERNPACGINREYCSEKLESSSWCASIDSALARGGARGKPTTIHWRLQRGGGGDLALSAVVAILFVELGYYHFTLADRCGLLLLLHSRLYCCWYCGDSRYSTATRRLTRLAEWNWNFLQRFPRLSWPCWPSRQFSTLRRGGSSQSASGRLCGAKRPLQFCTFFFLHAVVAENLKTWEGASCYPRYK